MAAKFQAGDLVKLKSGGPVMTVEAPVKDYHKVWTGEYACSWFAGAKDNHRNFAEAALTAATLDDD